MYFLYSSVVTALGYWRVCLDTLTETVNIVGVIVWIRQGSTLICFLMSIYFHLLFFFYTTWFFMCHFLDTSSFFWCFLLEVFCLEWVLQCVLWEHKLYGGSIRGPLRLGRKLAICQSHSSHSPITCTDPLQATSAVTPRDLWQLDSNQWDTWNVCRRVSFMLMYMFPLWVLKLCLFSFFKVQFVECFPA